MSNKHRLLSLSTPYVIEIPVKRKERIMDKKLDLTQARNLRYDLMQCNHADENIALSPRCCFIRCYIFLVWQRSQVTKVPFALDQHSFIAVCSSASPLIFSMSKVVRLSKFIIFIDAVNDFHYF
jgi:hypothetical protein